ncbi:MAG: translocation/assembly module TamB domain-containing protein [Candidatus Babeliales bacterium]|jgi:hypothetical protein
MFKVVTRVIIAFVGGLIFSLWMLQTSTTVKTFVGTKLITFLESAWDAQITYDKVKVNFFSLSMLFKHGAIRPAQHRHYEWRFDDCSVHVSIFDLLFHRKVALHLTFNSIKATTLYTTKGSDLIDHLKRIFATNSSSFEISPQAITINGIDLDVKVNHDAVPLLTTCTVHMPGRLHFCKNDKVAGVGVVAWHGTITPGGATITCNQRVVMHHEEGTFECYKNIRSNLWHMQAMLKGMCPPIDPVGACVLQGVWDNNKRSLNFSRDTQDLTLTLTGDEASRVRLKGIFELAYVHHLYDWLATNAHLTKVTNNLPLTGQGMVDLCGNYDKMPSMQGSLIISDLKVANVACNRIAFNDIQADSDHLHADVTIEPLDHMTLRGDIAWHRAKNYGTLSLTNTQPLELSRVGPLWLPTFDADACSLKLSCDAQGNMQGWYSAQLNDAVHNKNTRYRGVLKLQNKCLTIKGNVAKGQFVTSTVITPHFLCKELSYRRGVHELVHLLADDKKPTVIQGFIRWPLLRSLLTKPMRRRLANNNCIFDLSVDQQNFEVIKGTLGLRKGRFFIPGYYNLVQEASLSFAFDRKNKKLIFQPVELIMTKGLISCQRATLAFNDKWHLSMIHIPLMFDNVLINWGRDFYGLVYGNLLCSKIATAPPFISGSLILKRSLLKDTFFSDKEMGTMYGPLGSGIGGGLPLGLNIRVTTEKPIQAKTPTIETKATLDMKVRSNPVQGLYAPPSIIGRINLDSGVIKFFRNTLNIEHGKIQFMAGRTNDPLIDLVAKNRIGKYLITLQLTGSQQKPTLLLESSPDLAEEQIIGLLLAGSENATLQSDLAAMVMQNIDAFLLNSVKSPKNRWLDKISKTFKYVQIMPNLNDANSQSKLKGSISVDLGDQLHARLQKNLDLQKDFSAQLEYMLSDDINFKIVRDQGGDMGSEVEMRLKLG